MVSVPSPSTGEEKVLAGVAYAGAIFLWIPTIVILLIKKESAFVKFHCYQSLAFFIYFVVAVVLNVVLGIVGSIPFLGWIPALIGGLIMIALGLAMLVYWLILMIKAFQGETMQVPMVGRYIEENLMS